jgi:hypothetical protein
MTMVRDNTTKPTTPYDVLQGVQQSWAKWTELHIDENYDHCQHLM